jgi:hypothetical protein
MLSWGWIGIESIGFLYYLCRRLFYTSTYVDNVPISLRPRICTLLHIIGVCIVYIYMIQSHIYMDTNPYSSIFASILFSAVIIIPVVPALFDSKFQIRSLSGFTSKFVVIMSCILSVLACQTLFGLDILMLTAFSLSLSLEFSKT